MVVTHANPRLDAWRAQVRLLTGAAARRAGWQMGCDAPVSVQAAFYMPRPKSVPRSQTLAAAKPDLDKLCRAVGDAITQVRRAGVVVSDGLLFEDSRIVRWEASKMLTDGRTGVDLLVMTLGEKP